MRETVNRATSEPGLKCFLINLDRSQDRLAVMSERLQRVGLPWQRIPAVEGRKLDWESDPRVDIPGYLRRHGKHINPAEIGCYLSHLAAMRAFLDDPAARWALILEDDLDFASDFADTLAALVADEGQWDMVKLSGFHSGTPWRTAALSPGRSLAVMWSRMTGSAAYVINRRAAQAYLDRLLPMSLPYDHEFDKGWRYGLKVRMVVPLPTQLDPELPSTIGYQTSKQRRLRFLQRLPCFAYRLGNECRRLAYAAAQTLRVLVSGA